MRVQFLRHHGPYFPGEAAHFEAGAAGALIKAGVAFDPDAAPAAPAESPEAAPDAATSEGERADVPNPAPVNAGLSDEERIRAQGVGFDR